MEKRYRLDIVLFVLLLLVGAFGVPYAITQVIRNSTENALAPIRQVNEEIRNDIEGLLHPTPTVIPDPITIIHEVKSLAKLETIQYSVEKVITAEIAQNELSFLFGDRLLFVAHGSVIAGIDLGKMTLEDMWFEGKYLYVNLPEPEIFVVDLDNDKSYVYDRETGLLTKGDLNLETQARQLAEKEIQKAAEEDGILPKAQQNAEDVLKRIFSGLGFEDVVFTTKS